MSLNVAWILPIAVALSVAACNDDHCGANMHYDFGLGVCQCDSDAIEDGGGCTACADDEVVVAGACGCAAGEAKGADGLCATVQGLGSACDAATACTNATYSYCAIRGGVGSCTNQCAADTDCMPGYVCADWEAVPSCRTFTGYGAACTAPADCAGYDASFCAQGACVVQGCTVGVDDCPRDTKCCDFSNYGLGTMCAPAEYCS